MIKKNENISIIYGGSGKKYASRLKEILDEAKTCEKYNFNANIVMDSILCCDVLDKVIELVNDTRLAIIFLTKDDLTIQGGKEIYRPRQNVVLEMGMLLASIGFENCIFLADFDTKNSTDYELPSDITKIMPKCFDNANMDDVFYSVLDKVVANLRLVSHKELLFDDRYPFNYTKLFSVKDNASILQRGESEQKNAILELWTKEISSLSEVDQMMIFLLERLPMTNLFRYTDTLHTFFDSSVKMIENRMDGEQEEIYSLTFDIIKCIIGYTTTKAAYKMGKIDGSTASLRFVEYYNKIKYAVEDLEDYPNINNILAVNAYDYLALLSLVLFNNNGQTQYLLDAIKYFKVCESLAKRFDDSSAIMKGYIFYNLARAYDNLTSLCDESELRHNQELALRYSDRAVDSRRGWVTESSFPANLSASFSYEYFLARVFQYRMHEKYSALYNEQMLRDELSQINNEFNIYFLSDTSSNKLLMEIKEMLDNL